MELSLGKQTITQCDLQRWVARAGRSSGSSRLGWLPAAELLRQEREAEREDLQMAPTYDLEEPRRPRRWRNSARAHECVAEMEERVQCASTGASGPELESSASGRKDAVQMGGSP